MYFDTAYIAKFYFNEPDSSGVRELVKQRDEEIYSSLWALAEFHAVLHRRIQEGVCSNTETRELASRFLQHTADGLWRFLPVTETLLRRTSTLILAAPPDLFIRTGDAVHLTTAQEAGETEVWTNDRHMLGAASWFGLAGKSVSL